MQFCANRQDRNHQYVALKVYIHNSAQHRELPFYRHLNKFLPSQHPGARNVRSLLSSFEVIGPHGKHVALALQVSQMSIRDMDMVFMNGRGFSEGFVKGTIKELLEALDFLHSEVQSVHTGTFVLPDFIMLLQTQEQACRATGRYS